MISPETIEVSVTYGTRYTFFLREIEMAEEQTLRSKTFGLSDKEKAEKEYTQNVSVLKDLSLKKPSGLFAEKPEVTAEGDETVYIDDLSAEEAIDKFFAEKTPRKERIAYYAVQMYFLRLLPSDSF